MIKTHKKKKRDEIIKFQVKAQFLEQKYAEVMAIGFDISVAYKTKIQEMVIQYLITNYK